jgi:hypothetical protein
MLDNDLHRGRDRMPRRRCVTVLAGALADKPPVAPGV